MAMKKPDGQRKKKRVMSPHQAQSRDLPTTHWAYAVAMFTEKNQPASPESNNRLPDDSEFDIIHVRRLANQI